VFRRESVTSFYKALEALIGDSADFNDYTDRAAALLSDELGVSVTFCEIFGKRWSFLTGDGLISAGTSRRETFEAKGRLFGLMAYPDPGETLSWDLIKPLLIRGFSLFLI